MEHIFAPEGKKETYFTGNIACETLPPPAFRSPDGEIRGRHAATVEERKKKREHMKVNTRFTYDVS